MADSNVRRQQARMVLRRAAQVTCFLLLTVCVGAWASSYFARDRVIRASRSVSGGWYVDTTTTLTTDSGRLSLRVDRAYSGNFGPDDAEMLERLPVADVPTTWAHTGGVPQGTSTLPAYSWLKERWGTTWGHNRSVSRHGDHHVYCLELPFWMLTATVALMNVVVFRRALQRLRRLEQVLRRVCVHCGYDLRASRGRCPECGKPIRVLAGL